MSNLTPQQLEAAALLANHRTNVETAAALGVSSKTIQRWRKIPAFQRAIADVQFKAQEKVIEQASDDIAGQIKTLVPQALAVLQHYLTDETARGPDRLRAVQITANIAGLNQSQLKPETPAEENLKDYLRYLAKNNGNASHLN